MVYFDPNEGQVDTEGKGLLKFDGELLTTEDLPEGMTKVVTGSKQGDLKLFAASDKYFYVLSIQEMVPAKPKPLEEES